MYCPKKKYIYTYICFLIIIFFSCFYNNSTTKRVHRQWLTALQNIQKLKSFVNSRTIPTGFPADSTGGLRTCAHYFLHVRRSTMPVDYYALFARRKRDREGDPRTIKAKDETRLPRRRRCKGEDVLQVLATGKRCGTYVIDGSSLRVVQRTRWDSLFSSASLSLSFSLILRSSCSSTPSSSSSSSPRTPSHPMCRGGFLIKKYWSHSAAVT